MNKHTANFLLAFAYSVSNPIATVLKESFGTWQSFFYEEDIDNGKVYSIFILENQLSKIPYPIVDINEDICDLRKIKFFVAN